VIARSNTGAVAIIPVRVGSQRLPGKALLTESGRELFLHTCDQARKAANIDRVLVATDDDRVAAAAHRHDYEVVRTSPACRTGSERCAEAAARLSCTAVLDIQGDWPEVAPRDLEALVAQLLRGDASCNTLCVPLHDPAALSNPNIVKVVRGRLGKALYFSRAAVPYVKEGAWQPLRPIGGLRLPPRNAAAGTGPAEQRARRGGEPRTAAFPRERHCDPRTRRAG